MIPLGLLVTLLGFIISFLHWDQFRGGVQGLFNLHGLFFLWIVVFTVVYVVGR